MVVTLGEITVRQLSATSPVVTWLLHREPTRDSMPVPRVVDVVAVRRHLLDFERVLLLAAGLPEFVLGQPLVVFVFGQIPGVERRPDDHSALTICEIRSPFGAAVR